MEEVFLGVYNLDGMLATENLVAGRNVYGEKLVRVENRELRLWNPNRSKLSAAILTGLKTFPFKSSSKVLYLGAASGTTASHISDIVSDGVVFCVESSKTPMEKLVNLCTTRKNMIPIFFDANQPERYIPLLEKVDVVYQDISQKNQADILIKNTKLYLKEEGYAMIAIKPRSIDSTKKVETVISNEIARLKPHFKIHDVINLEPYEKDHAFVVCEKSVISE